MRSLKSSVLAITFSGVAFVGAVIGCSASGDSTGDTTDPTDPSSTSQLPPGNPNGDGGPVTDASKVKTDSGVDSGPPPPNPGDPCTKADAIATEPCGACGTAQAICQAAGDGGALVWSAYGTCQGELAGGCSPGATQACGNCGTQTCGKYCAFGSCTGEPVGACKAGTTDYSAAGCTAANTYKNRLCSGTCTYGSYSLTCDAPNNPNKMSVSGTANGVTTAKWNLATTQVGLALSSFDSTCPGAGSPTTDATYPYVLVEIDNPTAKKATVTLYASKATTGTADLEVNLWAYNKTIPPTDATSISACDFGVTEGCSTTVPDNLCGGSEDFYWAGLPNVTINAGASILVQVSSNYSVTDGFSIATGDFNLNVRTDKLQ